MVLLAFLSGSLGGTRSRFDQPVVRIGRARDCDVRLDDGIDLAVSSHHAEIVRDADGYSIIDIASTNGTWLGDRRIARHRLAAGDVILLGGRGGGEVRVEAIEGVAGGDGAPGPPVRHTVPMPRTPAPVTPGADGVPIAARVKLSADTATTRVADIAAARVAEERARAGVASSGQTMLIMADAVAETHRATVASSGRRWRKVVAAVAGVGVLVAAVMGVVIWKQRQEIRKLVERKQGIDRDIEAV